MEEQKIQAKTLAKLHHLAESMNEDKTDRWKNFPEDRFLDQIRSMALPHSGRKALAILNEHGELNQRTLAQMVGISPQAVSESVKKLEANGFVTKTNGKHKNENMISLTPLGKEISDMLKEIITNHAKEVFAEFSNEEVALFGSFLDKLILQHEKMQENQKK